MKLASNKMRMPRNFNHLHISSIRSRARNLQPAGRHRLFIFAIELIAMPVPLADLGLPIDFICQSVSLNLARPSPQTHRPAQFLHSPQLAELVNNSMWSRLIE